MNEERRSVRTKLRRTRQLCYKENMMRRQREKRGLNTSLKTLNISRRETEGSKRTRTDE